MSSSILVKGEEDDVEPGDLIIVSVPSERWSPEDERKLYQQIREWRPADVIILRGVTEPPVRRQR